MTPHIENPTPEQSTLLAVAAVLRASNLDMAAARESAAAYRELITKE